jgi:hypothetical protein
MKMKAIIDTLIKTITAAVRRFCSAFSVLPPVWFTYFPFVGWLYPFIAMKNDRFAMHHGKQAFIMAMFFTAAPIFITFSTVFIPISYRAVKLAVVIMVYLSHLAYFALCAWGFLKMKENVTYDFPVISGYAKKLDI